MSGLEQRGLCRLYSIFGTISAFSFMYGMFQNYCIFARSKSQHHGTQENKESTGEKYDQTEKEIQVHYWLQGTR